MRLAYMGILSMTVLPGILASIFHLFLIRKTEKSGRISRMIICYTGFFYGILSLVKMILDGGRVTMPESFKDILPATFYHYMIPLLILTIIVPLLISKVFSNKNEYQFMGIFSSSMIGILTLGFIIAGRINHAFYISSMAVSIAVAFWGSFYYKGEVIYCSKNNILQRIRYALPFTGFYVVTVMLSFPGSLFFNNRSEILISFFSFAGALLAGAVAWLVFCMGISVLFLTWRQFKLFHTILFAITLTGYIQSMILNGHMTYMDGGRQTWSAAQIGINVLIWSIMVVGLVLLEELMNKKDVGKVYQTLCIYLCLIQIVSVGYTAISNEMKKDNTGGHVGEYTLTADGALELHPEKNVLVFILDWYDAQLLEQILQENEDFLSPLDGFTYYANTTSAYAFTAMAVPYLLTGTEWQYYMDDETYREYAFDQSSLLQDIDARGYEVGVYTDLMYVGQKATEVLCNYSPCRYYCDIGDTIDLMLRCSKYQMAPFAVKNWFWYSTDEITELARGDAFTDWDTNNDRPFWAMLNETGLEINQDSKDSGNFRFYHMYGVHPPWHTSENLEKVEYEREPVGILAPAKGSFKIVFEYIRQLKALGLYDEAAIIITADHGQAYIYSPAGQYQTMDHLGMENTSEPILLVKNAGDNWEGVRRTEAQVSQKELIASIANAVDPQMAEEYGMQLEEVDENEQRERIYTFNRADMPYVKAAINGNVMNKEDWTIIERIEIEDKKQEKQ